MAWDDGLVAGTPAHEIAASLNHRIRVVAGPGTGKSFAMKRRVARLLQSGVEAETILPVTFTRVAAEDLHRELVGMNVPGCGELQGTTLHSLALKILVRNHVLNATNRTPRPLNEFEIKPLEADLVASGLGGVRDIRKLIKAYEAAWARLQRDDPGFAQTPNDIAFENALINWLQFHRAMLIGEVIPQLYSYLRGNPLAQERQEFSHILVDEYQDLNRAEQGVVELLSDQAEVLIVGDDDQSIYSFKHANPEGIRDWLIENNIADDLTLNDCRRCPTIVVDMANSLIRHNIDRPVPRPLIPIAANGPGDVRIVQYQNLDAEVLGVTGLVIRLIQDGTPPGDILILAQRSVIGTPIYEELVAQQIPVRSYYAESELENDDAQYMFALLKIFVDREDRVALRWLVGRNSNNWYSAGYRRIRDYCEQHNLSTWSCLEQLETGIINLPYCNNLVAAFSEIKQEIEQIEALYLIEGMSAVVDHIFPDGNERFRDIRALALQILDAIGEEEDNEDLRTRFLRELTSLIAKPEIPTEIEDVRIMSLHKSKGLSAPVTIIAGCIEGLLPKQPPINISPQEQRASIEEQRRLFYVGVTRVKAVPQDGKVGTLILTYAQRMSLASAMGAGISPARTEGGTAVMNASRFIREFGRTAPAPRAG